MALTSHNNLIFSIGSLMNCKVLIVSARGAEKVSLAGVCGVARQMRGQKLSGTHQ